MQYLWVDGVDQGQNVDLRVPPNNNPVTDVTSNDLTCNVGGTSGSGVSLSNGINTPNAPERMLSRAVTRDLFKVNFLVNPSSQLDSYRGTVRLVYIAKAPSTAASFDGSGAVWTKIYSSGLVDSSSQEWATDVVNANGGKRWIKHLNINLTIHISS
ncbi:hypothetical protein PHLCEN_2v1637 [Hermanssonia centrifuga]|uniref:lytic cellulose monooxygenase (C4-dehydrogenating) n=1 Tax=Hermanssonia centrifuga TaxID=98765 RepID=A0A2R6RZM2_9APHY|nr:hypothetical protein PHLCEN_2v1637 [Hermanssonia centrifuga]